MRKSIFLVDDSIFVIEYFWVPSVNDILDGDSVLVHFCLNVILTLTLGKLASLDPVHSHHILLTNLVEAITHLDLQLIFKSLESLNLNKLNVLKGTIHGLPPFRIK